MCVLKSKRDWPVDSVKVFLDDSLYSRVWVDHELSQRFVQNVKTILHAGDTNDAVQAPVEGDVRDRFHGAHIFQEMRDLSINHIRSRLTELEKEKTGSGGSSTAGGGSTAIRNIILTLIDFASIPQARVLAAENMEAWLQNPSVKGPTKELLNKIVAVSNLLYLRVLFASSTDRTVCCGSFNTISNASRPINWICTQPTRY